MNVDDARELLVDRFGEAGLPLRLEDRPLTDLGDLGIFQMDIRTGRGTRPPSEVFRLWPGAPENRLLVMATDGELRQVTLLVEEPRRRYERSVPNGRFGPRLAVGEKVLRKGPFQVLVEGWVDPSKRRFLCGFDERHLFIARFRDGTSVAQAHRSLDPVGGLAHADARPEGVLRQGEWFFVPATEGEVERLEALRAVSPYVVREEEALARARRPHVAGELIEVVPRRSALEPQAPAVRFVRGVVRHPDHAPLELPGWHKVLLNREPGGDRRVLWAD